MRFVDMELARRLELAGHPDCISEGNEAISPVELKRPGDVRIAVGGGIAEFRGLTDALDKRAGPAIVPPPISSAMRAA